MEGSHQAKDPPAPGDTRGGQLNPKPPRERRVRQPDAPARLTTTSFLVLGLLSTREWSAYEIAEVLGKGMSEV